MVHIIEPEYDTCMGIWVCEKSFIIGKCGIGESARGRGYHQLSDRR